MSSRDSSRAIGVRNKGAAVVILGVLTGCVSSKVLPLADNVDLERIYGGWYLVATIPNGFERGLVQPYDVYSRRADGDIREDFYFSKG